MTTYTDFQTHVRLALEEATSNVWSDSQLLWWTNEAVKDVARKARPRRDEEYTTCVSGQHSYTLPSGTLSVISVKYADANGNINAMLREDVDDLIERDNTDADGTPVAYAIDDEQILIRPSANGGTLRFWRYCTPTAIASTTATTDVPFGDKYLTAIEYNVLMRAFQQINDWNSAAAYRDLYHEAVSDASTQTYIEESAAYPSEPVEVY